MWDMNSIADEAISVSFLTSERIPDLLVPDLPKLDLFGMHFLVLGEQSF